MPILAAFADEFGIRYDLLSDVGSHTIRRLGLVNRHVEQLQAHYERPYEEDRHGSTPYPGVFTLDEQGVVVDRHFEVSYRVRPSATVVLGDLFAQQDPPVQARATVEWGEVAAWLHTDAYHAQELLQLHVAIALREPFHTYVEPVPTGYVPLALELSGPEALDVGEIALPVGEPWRIRGLPEQFRVVGGEIRTTVPFVIASASGTASLELRITCQVCTDDACRAPGSVTLPLQLQERALLRP